MRATGEFDVKLTPRAAGEGEETSIGRMAIDKVFRGDLQATSKGQMLAFRSAVEGSAGYVAMERITGSLGGRTGSFALQHHATMARGARQLHIEVVPDSGTEGLAGLSGKMDIQVADGKHSYEFDYTLTE
jgi:hypothetical protein